MHFASLHPMMNDVNDTMPTYSATSAHGDSAAVHRYAGRPLQPGGPSVETAAEPVAHSNDSAPERTIVDVRISVTQTSREISLELPDDLDRADLKSKIDAALTGAVDVLWLTDKKGRDVGVAAAKIAFVELGAAEGERRIGFGG